MDRSKRTICGRVIQTSTRLLCVSFTLYKTRIMELLRRNTFSNQQKVVSNVSSFTSSTSVDILLFFYFYLIVLKIILILKIQLKCIRVLKLDFQICNIILEIRHPDEILIFHVEVILTHVRAINDRLRS